MLTCIIIDDEEHACQLLKSYVEKLPSLQLKAMFNNAIQALDYLQQETVDLIFLDIQMPELTGMQVLPIINSRQKVIITTAYTEYALQGYEHDVVDYLLKPIAFERFYKAVHKALDIPNHTVLPKLAETEKEQEKLIMVKTNTKGNYTKIDVDDIYFVEGLKNYISIYTTQDRIVTLLNVKDLEQQLPVSKFVRIHKSYIVNIFKIQTIEGNQIILGDMEKNQKKVPIGVTYKETFFQKMDRYIMGKR